MQAVDRIAKTYESLLGDYRYPISLIGRTQDTLMHPKMVDVLVFAAHADDETLGLGTVLCRHRAQGHTVAVVFTTNGRGGSGWMTPRRIARDTAQLRYQEACNALSVIGVPPEQIHVLGFPDLGLYRFANECLNDVLFLIRNIAPKHIYVHSLDGGHVDHDVTHLIVSTACKRLQFTDVVEWAEYNTFATADHPHFVFPADPEGTLVVPTDEERRVKQAMLEQYESQRHVLARYQHKHEAIRPICLQTLRLVPTLYSNRLWQRALRATRDLQHSFANEIAVSGG